MTDVASCYRLLLVSHGWGGGVEKHLTDVRALLSEAAEVDVLHPTPAEGAELEVGGPRPGRQHLSGWSNVVACLVDRNYDRVLIHHIHGYPPDILALPAQLASPYDLVLHDFFAYCPQNSLADVTGRYCGEPDLDGCSACLEQRPHPWAMGAAEWRTRMGEFLGAAERVIAPSHFVIDRIQRRFPGIVVEYIPHPPRSDWTDERPPQIKVLMLGGLAPAKGLHQLQACALDAKSRRLPLVFCVLGYLSEAIPTWPELPIQVRGEYRDEDLPSLLAMERADVLWCPGQIPETYSYTLDVALATGLPIVASDFGAIAERLRNRSSAQLLPPQSGPSQWNQALLASAPPQPVPATYANTAARLAYRDRLMTPVLTKQPRPKPRLALDLKSVAEPMAPSPTEMPRSLQSLFEHGVECGHLESKRALRQRLEEISRDYEVLASYSASSRQPWYVWMSEVDNTLNSLRSTITQLEEERSLAETEITTLAARLQSARDQLHELEIAKARILEMELSTSWRITAPLRRLAMYGRRLRNSLVRQGGRLRYTYSRLPVAMAILRSEGPGALSRRMRDKLRAPRYVPSRLSNGIELTPIQPLSLATCPEARLPDISIVIPVYGHHDHTFNCLHSLSRHTDLSRVEIIVVDDASPEPAAVALAQITGIRLLCNPENRGFIHSCNRGAAEARGEFLVLLNNDIQVTEGWLQALLDVFALRRDAGLVGARLVYPDGKLQEAGGIVWRDASAWNWGRGGDPDRPEYNYLRAVDYCSGACLAIRASDWRLLGGFDTSFAPAYYEDTDLAFRCRAMGKQVYYQPLATVVHFEGVSSGTDVSAGVKRHQVANQAKFLARWQSVLANHRVNGTSPELEMDRRSQRHVLVVEACMITPDQDSGSVRMLAILELLQELGCRVSFVAENLEFRQPYVDQLRQAGVEVWHYPYINSVEQLLEERGGRYDCVMFCRHYIATPHLAHVRRLARRATVVFDTVDLHFLREQRLAELENSPSLMSTAEATRRQELAAIAAADITLVVSPVEQALLAQLAPQADVRVLSNIHEPKPESPGFHERDGILFVGGFRHPPNVDAVLWFLDHVWPLIRQALPELEFTIVGSNMPDTINSLSRPGVKIAGFVADIEPMLDAARISVAPLRYGAGVKGKLNQAMAHGLPVVATGVAAEGMDLKCGEELLVADSPEAFAAAVVRLYGDESLWQRLAAGGRNNIHRHFSRAVAKRVLAGILKLPEPQPVVEAPVDVVIPVFGQRALVQNCLASIFAAPQRTPFRVVVVDDASPDPELRSWLEDLAVKDRIDLVAQESNQGFVASANLGMSQHPDRDVILLNSDTLVAGRWLDRIVSAARNHHEPVATVTPWSNNATICSYPGWPQGGALPEGWTLEALAAKCAEANSGRTVPLPTAVGFCMFVARAALNQVGMFDVAAFGRGYGEENDFCLRAAAAGFHNILAADAYVQHLGGASFSEESRDLQRRAGAVIRERWPDYDAAVARYIAADPLLPLRRRLDSALEPVDGTPG